MAVSNAVGSNVFDILVCLGLPWFLKTGIFKPGSTIKVYSKGQSTNIFYVLEHFLQIDSIFYIWKFLQLAILIVQNVLRKFLNFV